MAGAIAGTAILKADKLTEKLHTITVTINNCCNMNCPHCYLQYKTNTGLLETSTIESIFNSRFDHLAIVGKEPLFNDASIAILEELILRAAQKSITVSFITNGANSIKLSKKCISLVNYVDISFDCGPLSYRKVRSGRYFDVIRGIEYLKENGATEINALHTIHDHNIELISDMVSIKHHASFSKIMFSPFLITENEGRNAVKPVPLRIILEKLSRSEVFMETNETLLLIDIYHLEQEGTNVDIMRDELKIFGLQCKARLIDHDPLLNGIIRVTYDDLVLSPKKSLHPKKYYESEIILASTHNLNHVYQGFLQP